MFLIRSFIYTGLICLIAQIIKDNTKLTTGHITSLFCSLGALLGFFGIYDKIIDFFKRKFLIKKREKINI